MIQTFDEFLRGSKTNTPVFAFTLNIIISAILATSLSWLYAKYGHSLSNRKIFGKNFLLITMTTMVVISIVKSSLALSLGLVGALSIIRFRTAIKEPEELAFLFFAIAIGLGLGADQTVITLLSFVIISTIIILSRFFTKNVHDNKNLYLTIQSNETQKINVDDIIEILKNNCDVVDLSRLDETKELLEVSFMVEVQNFTQLNNAKKDLQKLNDTLKITFLDNKGLL